MSVNPNFLERVRDSCVRLEPDDAKVDPAAAATFAKSLDIERIKFLGSNLANIHEHDAVASGTSFDVSFPNADAEINMISVAHALDFGCVLDSLVVRRLEITDFALRTRALPFLPSLFGPSFSLALLYRFQLLSRFTNNTSPGRACRRRSGFRHELHAYTGKGSWLSIKDGLENMYRKNPSLSAEWLASITETEIGELFNISATSADGSPSGLALLITHLANVSNEV